MVNLVADVAMHAADLSQTLRGLDGRKLAPRWSPLGPVIPRLYAG